MEIMFATEVGRLIPEQEMFVQMSREFSRRTLAVAEEAAIDTIWANRLKENPRLFNGTKFRVHSVSLDTSGTFTMNLGLTDYREYLGTNWAPNVKELQDKGQRELGDPQAYLSDAMGVGAFVVTSDDYAIFIRRSQHCAEAPDMWDIPGGHAEPEELVGKVPIDKIELCKMTSAAVAREIFHSILREVRDEVNIGEEHLSSPLLMGIGKNTTSGGRPSLEFIIRCGLTKDQVLQLYHLGSHAEADESTNILLLPISKIVGLQTEDPALWAQIAPSAKGCVILYKMSHG